MHLFYYRMKNRDALRIPRQVFEEVIFTGNQKIEKSEPQLVSLVQVLFCTKAKEIEVKMHDRTEQELKNILFSPAIRYFFL